METPRDQSIAKRLERLSKNRCPIHSRMGREWHDGITLSGKKFTEQRCPDESCGVRWREWRDGVAIEPGQCELFPEYAKLVDDDGNATAQKWEELDRCRRCRNIDEDDFVRKRMGDIYALGLCEGCIGAIISEYAAANL